jgi:hypothetical protein
MIANGTFDVNTGGSDDGDSIVKLAFTNLGLKAINYFTPFNQLAAEQFGPGLRFRRHGVTATAKCPRSTSGYWSRKGGTYLVNRNNPGHFHPGNNSQTVQSIPHGADTASHNNNYCTPAYWQGNVYFIGNLEVVRQYPISGGHLQTPPITGTHVYGFPGATPAVSANGNTNGILWTLEREFPWEMGFCMPTTRPMLLESFTTAIRQERQTSLGRSSNL